MKQKIFLVLFFSVISFCFAFDGAKYLIISPDNYVQYVQPLANWKTKKGVKTYIAPLSVTGNTAYQIKSYILNAYNNWQIRPEYILLVGAGTVLPSYSIGGGDYSDDYYGDISGDFKIELSIGRLPCTNTTQCQLLVAKILGFERTPLMTDTTWYRKGTTVLREDGTTHPDTVYTNDLRYIASFWRNYYTTIDSFSRFRGDDRNDIVNAVTNGRIFVVYRGEATVNWYTPFQVNPSQSNNGFKLPIVVSGTCGTISFAQSNYLGDNFMTTGSSSTPKGAVAFFGSSVSTTGSGLAWQRGTVTKGFFTALYRENQYKLGDAAKRAKFILDSIRPINYSEVRYKEWNLFGDPEMNMWTTVPKQLVVTHDTVIETRPQNFTVTVRQAGNLVNGALVCLMMDTLIYECSYTNGSGQVVFPIYPRSAGTMSVTVTAQNCIPYEKNVTINTAVIEHDVGIVSITQPSGTIVTGTSVVPKVKIKNYGNHTDSFPARFKIDTIYDQTLTSVTLAPNETTTVSFPIWLAIKGTHILTAYTILDNDEWRGNDTVISAISVIVTQDVGVEAILSPDTTHLQNTTMTPKAKIKNYGTLTQVNFAVICSIIGTNGNVRYTNTQTVSVLPTNDTIRISFNNWIPDIAELCSVKIRTNLINDQNPDNDQKIKTTIILATAIAEEKHPMLSPITTLCTPKPNPVTDDFARISFILAEQSYITLKIYDATGKIIKTITKTRLPEGCYNYNWDCKDEANKIVAEGVYFYSLETPNRNYTKKLIINRN